VRRGSSRRILAKTSSTTDISRRRGLVDAGGKRGQHRRRGSLWILLKLRLLALAFEFQPNLRATELINRQEYLQYPAGDAKHWGKAL